MDLVVGQRGGPFATRATPDQSMESTESEVIKADDSEKVTVSSGKDAFAVMNAPFEAMNTSVWSGSWPEWLVEAATGAMPVAGQTLESSERRWRRRRERWTQRNRKC
jgi:hypothetical protein